MSPAPQEIQQQLARLHEDFPGWAFGYARYSKAPWEAQRYPFRLPPGGGVSWIETTTPERLRELVGGVLQLEAQLDAEDGARTADAVPSERCVR
ncbi:hypothetical protein GCM10022254_58500 [Actinomadura meridiana]|uniref:Uncharacterized protein n=1 Tax=Actinomadura meridiana TaxID=559626 RepID=A0ABP8CH47_9ACTN